jgi:hypothetical protein
VGLHIFHGRRNLASSVPCHSSKIHIARATVQKYTWRALGGRPVSFVKIGKISVSKMRSAVEQGGAISKAMEFAKIGGYRT